jgi:hypothetical protein
MYAKLYKFIKHHILIYTKIQKEKMLQCVALSAADEQ